MILSTRSRQLGESKKIGLAVRVASARFVSSLILLLSFGFISGPAGAQTIASLSVCKRTITADVVALSQPIMLNRLGAAIPDGLVFALKKDTVPGSNPVRLKDTKRPRPLVLRANVGDCLRITFTNSIPTNTFSNTILPKASTGTNEVSLHVQGMQWVTGPQDDGSFVGKNNSSLADPSQTQKYTLYAKAEGTFLLYTMGDTSTLGDQLTRGLFGALNVQPAKAEWYRSQVTADALARATYNAKSLPANASISAGACTAAVPCTLKFTGPNARQIKVIKKADGSLNTTDNYPLINYDATDANGTPILKMLDAKNNIVHSDLTAMITGPNAGRFPGANGNPNKPDPPCNAENNGTAPRGGKIDPLFCQNPASPDRKQPYREITVIYHGGLSPIASQAFPILSNVAEDATQAEKDTAAMTQAGQDAFAINYGTGGIGAEIYANRIGVGPMGDCVDCKFEEFFLSAWSVGDPAMLVDKPANSNNLSTQPFNPATNTNLVPPCNTTSTFEGTTPPTSPHPTCANARTPTSGFPYTLAPLPKATKAFFPDDPSNVYHSYINDHVKFRILHGGRDVTHVHHQHAHQWLQSPNSDQGSYLDSQMISPGASYTLEMTYNGSGNRNKVVGDSIFHCHFYPHFAAGMWAMWRTHDVFEAGSQLNKDGIPVSGTRALPDGEIKAGTPNPAIVPLPTLPMAPLPSPVFIEQGQIVYGTPATPDTTGQNVTVNPGFPFFIPGRAGARAPHPPLDFAPDGAGGFMDGGLPRHLVTGGSIKFESHDLFDWSKDLETINATQLAEAGTPVEKVAISFFSKRCYPTSFPDGTPGSCPSPPAIQQKPPTGFIVNGLPLGPQSGAPFADPAVDDDGNAVGKKRVYKAAAIEMDVVFNKKRWHFPQQRILTLWDDVAPTIATTRKTEPLFFRGNSGDIIEYWHTNLVPNYYQVDDFQVRTPTDILGQHIHLVKFDVTSSDGAGNGFNYEDGTFAPEEVQEIIHAINQPGGSWTPCPGCAAGPPALKPPPAQICSGPQPPAQCAAEWEGAQTTIQRWYLDPLVDNSGVDRTLRTVFTHDHFGPSTHQQVGLYAGLVVEPMGSTWTSNDGATPFGARSDGGPTSWEARIITSNTKDSYREFLLEFQDLQLAYAWATIGGTNPPKTQPSADPKIGWIDPAYAINAPSGSPTKARPELVTTGNFTSPGTQSVNYRNDPIAWRVGPANDMSYAYDSALKQAGNAPPNGDPATPLMRAYQNDNVQVRVLVGAHLFAHQFNLEGPTWFSEPSWKNSGYRSAQAMGLSEHFEMLFRVPSSSAPNNGRQCPDGMSQGNCVDYLYSPSLDDSGIANGMWGLFRSYDPTKVANKLQPLPNNPVGPAANVTYATCPAILPPPAVKRVFNVTAVTAQKALANITPVPGSNPPKGQIVFNSRGQTLRSETGVIYVRTEDLDAQGRLKPGVPVEPLILRANAGDCIEVNLTNALEPSAQVFQQNLFMASPFNGVNPVNQKPVFKSKMSGVVGLHPQLLSYDAARSSGMNVGWNRQGQPDQLVGFGKTIKYQWYAGKIDRDAGGKLVYTPVEFGSLNLFPSDPVYQHINGLFGAMIIEPQGSSWQCGDTGSLADCDPSGGPPPKTRASATITLLNKTKFREFALMISDAMIISNGNSGAVNYRTEPMTFRYAGNATKDFSCMLSNQLIQQAQNDPQTPIFTAEVGDKARFRLMHPFGTGTSQVFSLHGHVWQRNPYRNDSREMGDNNLSQWIGSRDNHGSTDHFDIVVDKAGGESGRAGDYLYTVFVPIQARQGAWGIFRVGSNNTPSQSNAACSPIAQLRRISPVVPKKDDLDRFIRQPVNKDLRL